MNIDDVSCDVEVDIFVTLVKDHKEEIEPRHDRSRHGHIGLEGHFPIIPSPNRVGSCQDRSSSVERSLNTGFRNRDGLLFHRFVDGDLVGNVHLVKFVNGTDTVIGQHEGSGLDGKFTRLFVLDHSRCETGGGRCFSGRVDCSWQETADVSDRISAASRNFECNGDLLQELRFTGGWITNNTDVKVTSKVNTFLCLFMHTTHQLEQDTLFDDLVSCLSAPQIQRATSSPKETELTVDGRGDTGNETLVDVVGVDHSSELIDLFGGQRI